MRRGSTSSVRYRRAMLLLASAGGNRVPVIAQLVQADEDTVPDVIHRFNFNGSAWPAWTLGGQGAVPACSVVRTRTSSSGRPPLAPPGSANPSPLVDPQTRRLPAENARPRHSHRP
jgi:hypothetical protein